MPGKPVSPNYDSYKSLEPNFRTNWNLNARFNLYNLAVPLIDTEQVLVEGLALNGLETILDVGAADNSFLQYVRLIGHLGDLKGVEPGQIRFSERRLVLEPAELEAYLEYVNLGKIGLVDLSNRQLPMTLNDVATYTPREVEISSATAIDTRCGDSSFDIITANSMLYFLSQAERMAAYREFKRVLKVPGVVGSITSGDSNKYEHRLIEEENAVILEVEPPPHMNARFTTEKAELELPNFFEYVYVFKQHSKMLITDDYGIEQYLSSQLSMWDQYRPTPDYDDFTEVLEQHARSKILDGIRRHGVFADSVERSVFICSDEPLEHEPEGFRPISRAT